MRRINGSVVSILAIGLLAGSTAGITAQEEMDGPAGPASFTGKISFGQCTDEGVEVVEGVTRSRVACRPGVHEMTDERLAGTGTLLTTIDEFPGGVWLYNRAFRIEYDEGAWQGSPSSLAFEAPGEPTSTATAILVGEGAYGGLTAIAELTLGVRCGPCVASSSRATCHLHRILSEASSQQRSPHHEAVHATALHV